MRQHPPLSRTPDTYAMDASVPALVIDQETLDHLPAFHRAIAEVFIEKGRWQLADSEEQESAGVPGTHSCRDRLRGSSNVTTIIDVKVYNTIGN